MHFIPEKNCHWEAREMQVLYKANNDTKYEWQIYEFAKLKWNLYDDTDAFPTWNILCIQKLCYYYGNSFKYYSSSLFLHLLLPATFFPLSLFLGDKSLFLSTLMQIYMNSDSIPTKNHKWFPYSFVSLGGFVSMLYDCVCVLFLNFQLFYAKQMSFIDGMGVNTETVIDFFSQFKPAEKNCFIRYASVKHGA